MSINTLAARLAASMEGSNLGVPCPLVVAPVHTEADVQTDHAESEVGDLVEQHLETSETVNETDIDATLTEQPDDVVATEDHDSTDSIGATDCPTDCVTRDELQEHLIEDQAAHNELMGEIQHLKHDKEVVTDAVTDLTPVLSLESFGTGEVIVANIIGKQLAKKHGIAVPTFVEGTASLEAVSDWVNSLRKDFKKRIESFKQKNELNRLRKARTAELIGKRTAYIRKHLDEDFKGTDVKLPKDVVKHLVTGRGFTTNPVVDLERLLALSDKVTTEVSTRYLNAIQAMVKVLSSLTHDDDELSVVEILKKTALEAVDFGFYQELEPGNEPLIGGVLLKTPPFTGMAKFPGWFSPITKMSVLPGYQVLTSDHIPNTSLPNLTKEEIKGLLDVIDYNLSSTVKITKEYNDKVLKILEIGGNGLTDGELEFDNVSRQTREMAIATHNSGYLCTFQIFNTVNPLDRMATDTLFALLLWVEHTVFGK